MVAVEKLRKNAKLVKEREHAFDGFVAELEQAQNGESSISKPDGEADDSSASVAETTVLAEKVATDQGTGVEKNAQPKTGGTSVEESRGTAELSSNDLYEQVCCDEGVRLRIIGEYLSSVGKGGVPLTKGGASTLVAPALKPKTLDEAGNMALLMFKRDGTGA